MGDCNRWTDKFREVKIMTLTNNNNNNNNNIHLGTHKIKDNQINT